jgi:uncharacterized membrane protein YcgQ (UPF0703/DUF1980 family)
MDTYLEQAHVQLAKQAAEQLDEIEAKNRIVRRQDKLITDLMQKNDLTMQSRQTSQALEQRQAKQKQETQMRLAELKQQKQDFGETVEQLEVKMRTYKGMELQREIEKEAARVAEVEARRKARREAKEKKSQDERKSADGLSQK